MANLHLRNVPDELDAALTAAAAETGVSKNRRAIEALRRGLGVDQASRERLIDEIRRSRVRTETDIPALIHRSRPDDD